MEKGLGWFGKRKFLFKGSSVFKHHPTITGMEMRSSHKGGWVGLVLV